MIALIPSRLGHLLTLGVCVALLGSGDRATSRPLRPDAFPRSLTFEPNAGQADERVEFLSRGARHHVFLAAGEVVFDVPGGDLSPAAVRMTIVGADPDAAVVGADPRQGRINYLTGRDPSTWHTNVPTFARVRYEQIYSGVDLVYHGAGGSLEYDFIVAPDVDPDVIRVDFAGVDDVRVESSGELSLRVRGAEVRQRKPIAYQELADGRQEVPVGYVATVDGQIGFALGEYDRSRPLVIDPVLVYSTYLGGTAAENNFQYDLANDIAVDAAGNTYVTGLTGSSDFPTADPLFTAGGQFVAKFDPAGSLIYSTYLPAFRFAGFELFTTTYPEIEVDASGQVFVTGFADSDFPTTPGAYQETGSGWFVMKLSPEGSAVVYSTFVPIGPHLAVDAGGNVYLAGQGLPTSGFPAINPLPTDRGPRDARVAKLNATGSALVYAVSLGGSADDQASGIAVDGTGSAYVTGVTNSADFPTVNAVQPVLGNPLPGFGFDCFVTKINSDGSAVGYSTYLGGSKDDDLCNIAAGSDGHAYVSLTTISPDFPTWNAIQPNRGGGGEFAWDGAVTKLNPDGSFVFSTFLGGSNNEFARGVATDDAGNVYVAGSTESTDFPLENAIQPGFGGLSDAFVTKLNAFGSALIYSTALGGSFVEEAAAVAIDAHGGAHLTGHTSSTNFPLVNAVQPMLDTLSDAFVAAIGEPGCPDDVTAHLDIVTLPIQRIPFTPYSYQWVFLRNKTTAPIQGPLGYVLTELQNAQFLNSTARTTCVSASGDPFTLIGVGDGVLSPREWTVGLLFFGRTQPDAITYTPRVLAGAPAAGT
jgi:hypothetical protein